MAIDMNKPEPMEIGGHYHFTLSDYSAPEVTLVRPRVTDADVDFELSRQMLGMGQKPDQLSENWVKKHTQFGSIEALKQDLSTHLEQAQAHAVEEQKDAQVVATMASRLEQKIPAAMVQAIRDLTLQQLAADAGHLGMSVEEFRQAMGVSDAALEQIAENGAEAKAAMEAYAAEKKIEMDEKGLTEMVGEENAKHMVEEAKKQGTLDDLLRDAGATKARHELVSEAKVTYELETQEAADKRAAQYADILKDMEAAIAAQQAAAADEHHCCGEKGECKHGHTPDNCDGHHHHDGDCDCNHKK